MNKKLIKIYIIFFLLLIITMFFTLFMSFNYKFDILSKLLNNSLVEIDYAILKIRLFRLIMAFLIGGSLSISGLTFQAITKNPLAEPYLLGTSSGAGLGLCIGIALGLFKVFGFASLLVFSFIGALASIFIVYSLSIYKNKSDPFRLILAGVIVGSIFSSVMVFLLSISKTSEFHGIMGWFLGDLEIFDSNLIILLLIVVVLIYIIIFPTYKYLDILSLSDTSAISLGLNVSRIRKFYFIMISILVSVSVSLTGIIGFVGLVVPHILRKLVGPKHKELFFLSILGGGVFLAICELLSRLIIPGVIIPIGVVTALIGGPYFLFLLRRR
ncbi:iron ABC transporter permease [Candidatus Dependentiae bacterium]|nr:iron ABC transporter permease [Candidatus Dependentiae bacterium]